MIIISACVGTHAYAKKTLQTSAPEIPIWMTNGIQNIKIKAATPAGKLATGLFMLYVAPLIVKIGLSLINKTLQAVGSDFETVSSRIFKNQNTAEFIKAYHKKINALLENQALATGMSILFCWPIINASLEI